MKPKQASSALFTLSLFSILVAFVVAFPAAAQDTVTVGTVTSSGNTVDVPVYVRDVSGTLLGRDQPAGSKIQAYTLKVDYAPAAAVQSVTFSRAGITAGLTPAFEVSPTATGSISLLDDFSESTNLIPFTLNASAPGDQVAHLVFTLSSSAAPGSSITLTLDSSQVNLTNQGGDVVESSSGANLTLVNGAINIPQLSLSIVPNNGTVAMNDSVPFTVVASSFVNSDTTVLLSSSNTNIAAVPFSVTIPAASTPANFNVTGVGIGTTNINAALPPSAGGATASALITVTAPAPLCDLPTSPTISGPSTADVGKAYTITWPAVSAATDYLVEERTDPDFGAPITTLFDPPPPVTTTSASFTHALANRYYYRVRARNGSTGYCNQVSSFSNVISVLVSPVPGSQTRVLPVVGSTPGGFGSFFKTSVQLFNPRGSPISGKIVFHTQNTSGSSTDPSIAFFIQPGQSLSYPDLLPAIGIASGLGSADLVADFGSAFPVALVRVFNDAGTAGTTGLTEEPMDLSAALQNGDSGVLIAPADQKFRLNIGVVTLEQSTSMTFTVRDKNGVVVKTSTRTYPRTFFQQAGSATVLDGYALIGGETITIQVTAGSAFVYGSTIDNTTQDPSLQFATRVE